MKFFKHIILSIIALGAFAAPTNAQTDVKALTGALAETIREYANYADSLAFRIAVANRKNPTVLLGIAEAYNMNQDFDKTKRYAMDALAVQPDFAPSYVLLGKHCQYKFEHYEGNEAYKDSAIYYFKKAMEVNPLYPESYEYYAYMKQTDDPEGVLKMYLNLRDQRPDLKIGGTIASLQIALAKKVDAADTLGTQMKLIKKGLDTYEDQGTENLSLDELSNYCRALDFAVDVSKEAADKDIFRERILTVAGVGHEREATDPRFLSYMLAANFGLNRHEDVLKVANELFLSADTAKLHYRYMPYDYRYHALSLIDLDSLDAGLDRISEGMDAGLRLVEDMGISFTERDLAAKEYEQLKKDINTVVSLYIAQGRYDEAQHIREYQLSKKSEPTISDFYQVISVLESKYQKLAADDPERSIIQRELIEKYTKLEQDFPTDAEITSIYYNHFGIMTSLDQKNGDGNGIAVGTKLFNLEASNPDRDIIESNRMYVAAYYLAVTYFFKDDYTNAIKYALHCMDSDAYYAQGDQIFNACAKAKPKTAKALQQAHRPL